MKKHVILFLAANPRGTDRLALDREARAIRWELKQSGYRDRFDFVTLWAAEPLDLLRGLRELKPTVVHFSGHGASATTASGPSAARDVAESNPSDTEARGLYFHGAAGGAQLVSPDAIAQALDAAGASVQLVVLNACFTEPIAEALLAHVDCVVGMSSAIHDDAARSFAIGFYGGLGEHESVVAAFKGGRAAISLDGLPDAAGPQLKVRDGFDANQLVLAARARSVLLDLPCPYPGMRPYTADDAGTFHGRETEINELIGRLRVGERRIFVIGPSGSGKSSLVSAGVLPRLARGVAGLGSFVVRDLRPGELPATRLAQALDAPPGEPLVVADRVSALLAHRRRDTSVLILIDQLEELFTLATAPEREQFLAAIIALQSESRCAVIFTLRADFCGALMESPLWPEHREQLSRVEVVPLRGKALRLAITGPAREVGVEVEPDLVERLVADAASEPGILPLLQETLVQLWDRRAAQTLTLADYEALSEGERSGLAVAISRRAETTLRKLTPAQTAIARRILLRLISFGDGRLDTRRQQARAQLRAAGDDAAGFAFVLQTMVDDRLLTVDEDVAGEPRVDLAHEIMISAWPTLGAWVRTHRADEQRRRQLAVAATQWVEHGRGARGLLDPIELADADQWQQTESAIQLGHSEDVMTLVAASRAAQAKQRSRRQRLLVGAFTVLSSVALVVAFFALAARREADHARASDRERQLQLARLYMEQGRQLVVAEKYQEAIPYLLEARRDGLDEPSVRMLFHAAKRGIPLAPPLEHQAKVTVAVFSRDGTRVVTASDDGTARVWDAATGKPLTGPLKHQGYVRSAAFSSDGMRVVTASWDGTAKVWDAATGQPLTVPLKHQGYVRSAAFSPDGQRVVTASNDTTAQVWDAATGRPLAAPLKHHAQVGSAAFSPDGKRVLTASESVACVWDAATGRLLTCARYHRHLVTIAAFSPDGTRFVTASDDKTARVWDAATGQPLTGPLEHQANVTSAAFSPDGTRVVTACLDKTARIWDAATGQPLTGPLEHQAVVNSAAFSPDGTRVVTASGDEFARGTAWVWDVATGRPLTSSLAHQGTVVSAAFSPDGTRVVTASDDKSARVWDAATGRLLTSSLAHQGPVMAAAFSLDAARVVTASYDKTARIWDAATGKPLISPLLHQGEVKSAAFSPDGTRVVTASLDGSARVWDAATGTPLTGPLQHQAGVVSAAFCPNGTRLVTASYDKTARVWDAVTGRPITGPLQHKSLLKSATFSPDCRRVVTASWEDSARVWDAATGKLLTDLGDQFVESAAFSPDGARVVTASFANSAQIWDAVTGKPLTSPLEHQGPVSSAAFSPNGARVVTTSDDRTARVWDAATGKPLTSPLEHQRGVESAEFSTDGMRVVTASEGSARVWDAATGQPLTVPLEHLEHLANVNSAAFSLDGASVVTASADGTTRVWDVRLATGALADWERVAERSPFVLVNGALMRRSELRADAMPPLIRGPSR